jgi:TIR domain
MEWDVFVSHASEDKTGIARPLAERLRQACLNVWFDETELTLGDSLRRKIDSGLAKSRFGVVIISPSFLAKEWPQKELDGLVAWENGSEKVILPVWHRTTADDVKKFSPILAGKLAVSTDRGLEAVVRAILDAVGRPINSQSKPANPATVGISSSIGAKIFCTRCGALAGKSSQSPGYMSHSFVTA